ncbi:unnamed protein product [Rhizophagus irregularis]|uniref:Uncharacterized protein n=1 Tax=Rhizophagus irregularis TaxID=588596 RepID=A0A915YPJ6_9GLOM|nr:unnamed protein product [Rhizophagus irregularis]CAB5306194.1 unnamed protein product [Rhizophagus irregularis]
MLETVRWQCGADMEGAEFQDDIQKRKEFGESKANIAAKKNKNRTTPVTEDEVVDMRVKEDTDSDSDLEGDKAEASTKTSLKQDNIAQK